MPAWHARGTSFYDKKNPDLTTMMWRLVGQIGAKNVEMVHVKSHNKDPGANPQHVKMNAVADRFAVLGVAVNGPDVWEQLAGLA
jgi:hypothetical protein